jgi:hypothetical protein
MTPATPLNPSFDLVEGIYRSSRAPENYALPLRVLRQTGRRMHRAEYLCRPRRVYVMDDAADANQTGYVPVAPTITQQAPGSDPLD